MRAVLQNSVIAILLVGMTSCDREEFAAKELGPFKTVSANGGVTFNLVQGTLENKVISTSLNEASYSVSNEQLTVNATNGSMTIAVAKLELLSCNGCNVENEGSLVVDTLMLSIHAGDVELSDIHVNKLFGISAINSGTYELSGTATFLDLSIVNSINFKGFNLVTDSTHINSGNAIASEVHATKVLDAVITSAGDVHYKGNPPVVRTSGIGTGKAIPE